MPEGNQEVGRKPVESVSEARPQEAKGEFTRRVPLRFERVGQDAEGLEAPLVVGEYFRLVKVPRLLKDIDANGMYRTPNLGRGPVTLTVPLPLNTADGVAEDDETRKFGTEKKRAGEYKYSGSSRMAAEVDCQTYECQCSGVDVSKRSGRGGLAAKSKTTCKSEGEKYIVKEERDAPQATGTPPGAQELESSAMSRRIPNPPGTRPCCTMPYYPSPNVDTKLHSDSAETNFYVVERSFVVGTYTEAKLATQQVEGYRGGYRVKVPCFEDAKCSGRRSAEAQFLSPTASVSTAVSSTNTASFGAAQRKFVQDAVSGKPTPLPGVQANTSIPASCQPAPKPKPPLAAYANSGSRPTCKTESTTAGNGFGTGAAAFSKMGDGPPVDLHWGVKGVYHTYASHLNALAIARKLNIPDKDIIGDPDSALVEAWVKM
ncbi:hypothetical protein C8F04DRAFT_1187409 [Mycena alexandri]|uniref:Uncharacterized protein n=1 Tax=Mycena alexandri TaxID=1745969 RepID=A0AAD6SM91_9AGAR|nr:hypothetical protein C8F04DRAFT_1187409 [Mycena alexandri]